MAERRIGPFLIEKQLGAGGMGIVYLATYEPAGKKVALKVLTPALSSDAKLLKRFEREIDILKKMSHPNIVKYYGGGTKDGQRYYAMEFVDGGSLQDVLKKRGRLNVEQTIQVGRQLCAALEHAHNAGIIHRDLKPANLFISRKGRLKLGDFGIARDTEATALTAAGKTVGTYAYMAPEQIHGNAPISRKTDLYATGCLLYEILTGETPFLADNPAEMLIQHLNDDPHNVREFNKDCPIWLDELIDRMLSKNPDERPYDALAVHTELSEMLRKLTHSEAVASTMPRSFMASDMQDNIDTVIVGQSTIAAATESATDKPRKKKKKKRDQSPFYERTWFLLTCLGLLIGGAVWFSLPPGEETLYELCRQTWQSNETMVRRDGRQNHMLSYLERFPEGTHASEIQQWANEIAADTYEQKRNPQKEHDFEIAYWEAREKEDEITDSKKGNLLEPLLMYHAVVKATENNSDAIIVNIAANRRVAQLREQLLDSPDRTATIRQYLLHAELMQKEGNPSAAAFIWFHFREVFYGVREVEEFYLYARDRSHGKTSEVPNPPAPPSNLKDIPLSSGNDPEESSGNQDIR
ncbi:MAG: serine/threonine-protein kinase [Planctomycetaceae bacterium]